MKKFIIALVSALSLQSFAQENVSTLELEEQEEEKTQSTVISLSTLPILLSGFGAGADYSVVENASVGVFGGFYKIKRTEAELDEVSSEVSSYGLRARYFLNSSFSQQGWYSSLSLISTNLTVTAEPDFGFTKGIKESNSVTKTGAQIGIGYQLIGRKTGDGQFCFIPEINYGMGNKIGYAYSATTSRTDVEAKLENGVGIEANIGWMF